MPDHGAAERPRLTFDLDVDVCVVGGGLAGLTVAREIGAAAAGRWRCSRRGGSPGTRPAAIAASSCRASPPMHERLSNGSASITPRRCGRCPSAGVDYVRDTIRDSGMPGVDPVDGWLDVSKVGRRRRLLPCSACSGRNSAPRSRAGRSNACARSSRANHYFHAAAFSRAPFTFIRSTTPSGWRRRRSRPARASSRDTPALEIDPAGVRKRVRRRRRACERRISCWPATCISARSCRTSPRRCCRSSYVAVTAPLGPAWATQSPIAARSATPMRPTSLSYRRRRPADVGGRDHLGGRPAPLSQAPAGRHRRDLPATRRGRDRACLVGRHRPSVHRMPQIGEVSPGLWLASAFGGHGLNTTAMAGNLIARAIVEGDDPGACSCLTNWCGPAARSGAPPCRSITSGTAAGSGARRANSREREKVYRAREQDGMRAPDEEAPAAFGHMQSPPDSDVPAEPDRVPPMASAPPRSPPSPVQAIDAGCLTSPPLSAARRVWP